MKLFNRKTQGSDVDPDDVARLFSEGSVLIDVREDDEWRAGHATEALHIPLGTLRSDMVPTNSGVITVCRSGARSAQAAIKLRADGLTVYNLTGGMKAWAQAGHEVVDCEKQPGAII
jgi:rhodanese-related sulfurtransferase